VRAREAIRAQLDELQLRTAPYCHGNTPPPDYGGFTAELERELGEIEELLGTNENEAE
jgi:hypothetical protein